MHSLARILLSYFLSSQPLNFYSYKFCAVTYLMLFFNGITLPDDNSVTEFAHYVSLVELIHIGSYVIGLAQIEVNVLLGHTLIHL